MALLTGIEPAVFGVTGRCFNRLNYRSMFEDFIKAVPQTARAREDCNLQYTAFYSIASHLGHWLMAFAGRACYNLKGISLPN